MGVAASTSTSRLNSSHIGLGSTPSSLSLLTRSPSILASSASSSSSSHSRLPTLPNDAATPAAPTTHDREGEEGPVSPPRLTGLLRRMSSSLSLARGPSLQEHEPDSSGASSMVGDAGEGPTRVGGGGHGGATAVAVVECRPSAGGLPEGERFSYCDHGFLAWPSRLDERCVFWMLWGGDAGRSALFIWFCRPCHEGLPTLKIHAP